MSDLSKHTELTDITFDHENAHLAVCHASQNYSANLRPDALLFKSNTPITAELTKSLTEIYSEEVVEKMSADNKRRYLESLVTEKLKESFPERDYLYAYVVDYNDDMVAFNFDDEGLYAVDYNVDEATGTISLGSEPRKVLRADIYVESDTGEILIKANLFKELPEVTELPSEDEVDSLEDGEIKTGDLDETPSLEEENDMTDKANVEDLLKSAEAQEMLKAMAAELAQTQFEELQKAAQKEELVKSTSEIVKGFEGIDEGSVEGIVKCLVDMEQGAAGELLKAMSDLQSALVEKSAEVEAVKKEFGEKQTAVEAEVEVTHKSDRKQELSAVVNKMKNK